MKKNRFLAAVFALFCLCQPGLAAEGQTRTATLRWRPVENSKQYELQLSTRPEMDPVLFKKVFSSSGAKLSLKPGTYFFRVRGVDSAGLPGPWTEVEGFAVNPLPPRPVSPQERSAFTQPFSDEGILFQWEKGVSGSKYLFEVSDARGAILQRRVTTPEVNWRPFAPGDYAWRVGYETPSGEEWGKPRAFSVAKSALPELTPIIKTVTVKVKEDGKKVPDETRWTVLGRVTQSLLSYSASDPESGTKGTGSAFIGSFSAELRWREIAGPKKNWAYSVAGKLEVARQVFREQTSTMPRANLRVFYLKQGPVWLWGPLVHLGFGQTGVFLNRMTGEPIRALITRQSAGAGGMVIFLFGDGVSLYSFGMARLDLGGTGLPGPLSASPGLEGGAGIGLSLGAKWALEGRFRAMTENFSWATARGQSSLNYLYLIGDVGLGYRF